MAKITLITGGGRSGKSRYALEQAAAYPHRIFIATAQAFDEEMNLRIARHRAERDALWQTIEEPLDLAAALAQVTDPTMVVVIDCLTVWLGNLMYHDTELCETSTPICAFLAALRTTQAAQVLVVTNEVGMGIVPADPLTRRWRDLAGRVNQAVAELADHVLLMICGYPIVIRNQVSATAI